MQEYGKVPIRFQRLLGITHFLVSPKGTVTGNHLRTKKQKYNQVCFGSGVKVMFYTSVRENSYIHLILVSTKRCHS